MAQPKTEIALSYGMFFFMKRYRVKYHYGAGTSGEKVLELQGGAESEALAELLKFCPSDVQVINIIPA